jgi:hypothetical protein
MDLNPREAVVDQEPSHTSEQEEKPTNALIVPENFMGAAMDTLNLLAALQKGVVGTHCLTTRRPRRDYGCGDVAE